MKSNGAIIGIDPGKKGAVAIIDQAVTVHRTPMIGKDYDERGMFEMLRDSKASFAVIETVWIRPGEGRSSGVTMGMGYGLWRGMLVALEIPYEIVSPQSWKRRMVTGLAKGTSDKAKKDASILAAKRLFPGVRLRHSDKCTVDNDNFAEALLIAEFGRRYRFVEAVA